MKIEAHRTSIQNFYAGQSTFITGGTGFLGNVLIEKLLRSCPDIFSIYLLIRPKKNKCPESRLDKIFEKPLYDQVKKEIPNFRAKIVPIVGDLDSEDFGLSINDKNKLINQASVIFHVAGNVRFDEKINISTIININATDTILKLARHMPNLKSFIHVSTAYANCHVKHIEERFYSYPINYKDFVMMACNLPENVIKEKISRIISQWPNVYTFTKAMAESLLRHEGRDLPIGIFRPSIVLSCANEPLVGWIDNKYGPIGPIVCSAFGITRFLHCNPNVKIHIVPVDFTINALIASAWDVFEQRKRGKDMLIYFVSPVDGPTWNEYFHTILEANKMYPLYNAIYFPLIICLQHKMVYKICVWLGHFLPALLMDAINICTNPKMWKICMGIDKLCKVGHRISVNEWSFSTDNVRMMWDHLSEEDKKLFKFNMVGFDWTNYIIDQYKGIRLYLLNENDSTLESSRIKYKRFYWIHQMIKTAFTFAILWIIWIIFRKMFA